VECTTTDVLTDFEFAIHNGANVISVTFSQDMPLADETKSLFHEPFTFGSLHTIIHDVFVICSTGVGAYIAKNHKNPLSPSQ
jgi:ribose 5-phosphate isomerase RpiB